MLTAYFFQEKKDCLPCLLALLDMRLEAQLTRASHMADLPMEDAMRSLLWDLSLVHRETKLLRQVQTEVIVCVSWECTHESHSLGSDISHMYLKLQKDVSSPLVLSLRLRHKSHICSAAFKGTAVTVTRDRDHTTTQRPCCLCCLLLLCHRVVLRVEGDNTN